MTPLRLLHINPLSDKYPANKCLLSRGCCPVFSSVRGSLHCAEHSARFYLQVCVRLKFTFACGVSQGLRFISLHGHPVVHTGFGKHVPMASELPWHLGKVQGRRKPAAACTPVSSCRSAFAAVCMTARRAPPPPRGHNAAVLCAQLRSLRGPQCRRLSRVDEQASTCSAISVTNHSSFCESLFLGDGSLTWRLTCTILLE